jgi:hypothetical protein
MKQLVHAWSGVDNQLGSLSLLDVSLLEIGLGWYRRLD